MSNIVVMEDDEVQAEMLAESLNLMGHEVTRRRNAEEALEAVLAEPPDLLITDIFVKQDDRIGSNGGVLLIGRVRNAGRKEGAERLADLPILAISGGFVHSGGLSIEEISRSIGATTFLAKPFSFARLKSVVADLLGQDSVDPEPEGEPAAVQSLPG